MEKGEKDEKYGSLKETKWHRIWEVSKFVFIVLLVISPIIAWVIHIGVVKGVIIIASLWTFLSLIVVALEGKSKIEIKDFFRVKTLVIFFVLYVIGIIIRLYGLLIYHI